MAYSSQHGRRPQEWASKVTHSQIIQDPEVQAFLARCRLPAAPQGDGLPDRRTLPYQPVADNPIRHVIAIDGGYTEIAVRDRFPSATLCFFQLGALTFRVADLERLDRQAFIEPEDIARLKRIRRLKFVLPERNVILRREPSLRHSVRRALYTFCYRALAPERLIASLGWLLYGGYQTSRQAWRLGRCPICGQGGVALVRAEMTRRYTFPCPHCDGTLYLTDALRLHELVDEEWGASEILGYTLTAVEQLLLVHLIRLILRVKPPLLHELLFIKDGPLAFYGPPSALQQPMRALVRYLHAHHALYLAGLEKSGGFVEHADAIADLLPAGSLLLLDSDYVYRYILPGRAHLRQPYGHRTYYGHKLVFKAPSGALYVVTVPTGQVQRRPALKDYPNLPVVLTNLAALQCDMYDSALVPVALVNQLVSLSQHPSTRILQRFAKEQVGG